VSGVAAPAVGPWQRQLNELGGVKPLAFGQYGELGPGFEQLLDQLAEEGADEAAKRYLIPNRVVAKGVQLRLLRHRVVMTAQKAQADVLLRRLHSALPVWDAAAERRDASRRAPQRSPGKGVGGRRLRCGPRPCFRRRGPLGSLEPGARPQGGGGGGCARALAAHNPPPPPPPPPPHTAAAASSLNWPLPAKRIAAILITMVRR
jgi:hypothetical protein